MATTLVDVQESKKQKLEQISNPVGDEDGQKRGESYVYDYDPPVSDFGDDEKLRKQWILRRQILKDSDGFDVGPYDGTLIDGCYLMDLDKKNHERESLDKCALYAIDDWNKKHKEDEELKFSKILKSVYAASRGDLFYITLEAQVVSSGVKKVYQTKVMDDFIVDNMKVYLFRAKTADKN